MNRRSALKAIGSVLFLPFGDLAFAATKPTLKCTRIGQQIVWRGKKYTCIKSGKSLVWDNGVTVGSTSQPSSSPSVQPTPQSTSSKRPYAGTVVGKSSDLSMGETKIFAEPDPYGRGPKFVITRTPKGLVAFSSTCTHEGCAVEVKTRNELKCPCHGAQFDAITGAATHLPAYESLREYKVEELNEEIILWIY